MIIFPAIDLKEGQCVRLYKGDMSKATVFSDDPGAQAKQFEDQGAAWLHVVDLNGAFDGKPVNEQAVESIIDSVSIPVQLGGGIRNLDTIRYWFDRGVERVILGTVALRDPALVKEACTLFPQKIMVGVDAMNGMVAVEGWVEASDVAVTTLAARFEEAGVAAIIYTDINRDGALLGPDITGAKQLCAATEIPIILSGGMATIDDVQNVKRLQEQGVMGVIIGRALYDGKISLRAAIEMALC